MQRRKSKHQLTPPPTDRGRKRPSVASTQELLPTDIFARADAALYEPLNPPLLLPNPPRGEAVAHLLDATLSATSSAEHAYQERIEGKVDPHIVEHASGVLLS